MMYLQLFWEFFKTGLFAVGGGMATVPFLSDMGEKTGWFSQSMLADMIAVSESTPGPIGVNMATYVGYTVGGVPGSLVATIGLITPSIIVILIIAAFLKAFRQNRWVERVFYGIRPASTALIADAGVSVLLLSVFSMDTFRSSGFWTAVSWKGLVLFAAIWVLTNVVKPTAKLHPIFYILGSAAVGIVFKFAGA